MTSWRSHLQHFAIHTHFTGIFPFVAEQSGKHIYFDICTFIDHLVSFHIGNVAFSSKGREAVITNTLTCVQTNLDCG